MALKKLDLSIPDSRQSVTLRNDPTRIDPQKLKLGKQTARHDPRTLLLASYVTPALPTPPASFDLTTKVSAWGMMDNDQIGDCTCAAAGHLLMEWTANAGKKMFTPTDKQIVAAYSAITGYNPTTGANDNGAVELDVLNYWRQSGIAGHKIGAYVALEPANHAHVMDSVYIFEGCYIGLRLPKSAQAQVQNHQPWSVPPGGPTRVMAPPDPGRARRSRRGLRRTRRHGCDVGSLAGDDVVVLGDLHRRSLRDSQQRLSDQEETNSRTGSQLAAVAVRPAADLK